MLLQLVGIDRVDNRALVNFDRRVNSLVRRRRGGDAPNLQLRICKVDGARCAGDLHITHEGETFRYAAEGPDAKGVLIDILARVMKEFRFSLTDLIKCG
ncbi:MAG: hypothetical protein HUU29_00800 [Planctomycetaceae bacterium]|nr:hypothetical protein [Planctomycetaceae bacterium]